MTRVNFYILPVVEALARLRFACRLTEKAFGKGHKVYLHAVDESQAQQMDELLWTYRPSSFVPHTVLAGSEVRTMEAPVAIGYGSDPGPYHDVLVNLALDIPNFFSRFERVTEIVTEDEAIREAKRENFRFYRDRGYPSENHRIERLE